MNFLGKLLGGALSLFVLGGVGQAREMAAVFDKPASEEIVTLPRGSEYPNGGKISCFYYDGFMVKEVDTGQKAAEKLSVTPASEGKVPPCGLNDPEERAAEDWFGYFEGVKGRYVFFAPDDGYNGVFEYGIFDAETGAKLLEIKVEADYVSGRNKMNIHDIDVSGDALTILYRRAFVARCSLYDGKSDCWPAVKKELGLAADVVAPDCRDVYRDEQQRMPNSAEEGLKAPTVFGYEVKQTYMEGQSTITLQPGGVSCWMTD